MTEPHAPAPHLYFSSLTRCSRLKLNFRTPLQYSWFAGILSYSVHYNSYKTHLAWSLADVCVCESLWGVTSKCRDPRQRVPRGVPVVWSLHISRIPRYAGLITLASSAAPWLPLCTDSCWPPLTNILLLVLQSTFPFFCLLFHPSFTPCVCVCVCQWVCFCSCGSDPSFHLDKTRSGTEVEVASACL